MDVAMRCADHEHRVDGRRRPGTYRRACWSRRITAPLGDCPGYCNKRIPGRSIPARSRRCRDDVQRQHTRSPQGLNRLSRPFDYPASRCGLVAGGGLAAGRACRRSCDPYPASPFSRGRGLTTRTGPLEALKTLVETLPTLNLFTAPRPRLPTAMGAVSGVASSASLVEAAAGSPTAISARGRIPEVSSISATRASGALFPARAHRRPYAVAFTPLGVRLRQPGVGPHQERRRPEQLADPRGQFPSLPGVLRRVVSNDLP